MNSTIIRHATEADIPSLLALIDYSDSEDHLNRAAHISAELFRRNLFAPDTRCGALVAEVEGRVMGAAHFHEFQSAIAPRPSIWLDDLYVVPHRRGQGLGTSLIEGLCCYALENDFQAVDFTAQRMNRRGLRLYRRLGAVVFSDTRYCRFTTQAMETLIQDEAGESPES